MGHVPLTKHLYKIGKANSLAYSACFSNDSASLLVAVPSIPEQRKQMERKLRQGARLVQMLLTRPKAMAPLFQYINATGRFRQTFGDI